MSIERVTEKAGLVLVATVDDSEGYDFDALEVYYGPRERRFFWYEDRGCSCAEFGDDVGSLDELSNGSREDALRAVSEYSATRRHVEYDRAVLAIKDVKVER